VPTMPAVPLVFVAVAVVFVVVALQNYLKSEGKLSPARKTWLRIALIFSLIGIGLFIVNTYFP
jgi:hypothetical protein